MSTEAVALARFAAVAGTAVDEAERQRGIDEAMREVVAGAGYNPNRLEPKLMFSGPHPLKVLPKPSKAGGGDD